MGFFILRGWGLNLPRQQESVYHALSSLSRLQKLRHLALNIPLTPAELRAVRNPPWDMPGHRQSGPQPGSEISADHCKEIFNYMFGEQEKSLNLAVAGSRAPLRMLVIKIGEWESFNYYSNRASENKYMWICRRLNDGLLRTWFAKDSSFGYLDEQYEDVLLSHGFAVPWDPSRSAFETRRKREPGFMPLATGRDGARICGTAFVKQPSRRGSCMARSRRRS